VCSAVFVTGLPVEFAAENVGASTAPFAERAKLGRGAAVGEESLRRALERLLQAVPAPS